MLKKLILILIFPSLLLAQNPVIKGTMSSVNPDYEAAVVYQLNGAKQLYVNYGNIKDGKFTVEMPETATPGMYRLIYDFQQNGFVNFIYNNKDVEFTFDPTFPSGTTKFVNCEENDLYNTYILESEKYTRKLDSIQLNYFNNKEVTTRENLKKEYDKDLLVYTSLQGVVDKKTNGYLANSFIKAMQKYFAKDLLETPQEYLNSTIEHYFDFIDFNDQNLINSTYLSERIIEYVFYLNVSEDYEVQQKLYKKSLNEALGRVDNNTLKNDILTAVLYTFANEENTELIDFVLKEYYNKLPVEMQSQEMINEVLDKVKLAVGKIAPDFSWIENNKTQNLSNLDIAETYILVFWSTSCSHCLKEVPQLYEYTKDKENVHVLAYALENAKEEFEYHTLNFVKWTNILGLDKWNNNVARLYDINATPFYFVLDKNKKIVAKPEFFEDVKVYLESLPVEKTEKKEEKKPLNHKVVSGNTLFSIAKKYDVSVAQIKELNNLKSNTLKVGQILKIKDANE